MVSSICAADAHDLAAGISTGNVLEAGSTDMDLRIGCEEITPVFVESLLLLS
jgi:hypothetical protein